jgi:hypothetical protein
MEDMEMTTDTNDSLAKAVEYLSAVEVAPGRFAFHDEVRGRWYVSLDDSPMIMVGQMLDTDVHVEHMDMFWERTYRNDCVLMPLWWTPGQRTITRCTICGGRGKHTVAHTGDLDTVERITADLNTGAEVPA